jgi:hypothetical protein
MLGLNEALRTKVREWREKAGDLNRCHTPALQDAWQRAAAEAEALLQPRVRLSHSSDQVSVSSHLLDLYSDGVLSYDGLRRVCKSLNIEVHTEVPVVREPVGIVRYPLGQTIVGGIAHENGLIAQDYVRIAKPGATLVMPSTRDEHGEYFWDFQFVDGEFTPPVRIERAGDEARPRIVCLCGSIKFKEAFEAAAASEADAGRIVLTVSRFGHHDGLDMDGETKQKLDELHKRKIDVADEILVLNVNDYIGESTRGEITYAKERGKVVRYLESTFRGDGPLEASPV